MNEQFPDMMEGQPAHREYARAEGQVAEPTWMNPTETQNLFLDRQR
jgi:hypothetical protein